MLAGTGSSTEASCCVARKIMRSEASASSNARTEPGRPILKATLVKGKMTTSRIGTIGSRAMSGGVRSEYSSITENQKDPVGGLQKVQRASLTSSLAPHTRTDFKLFHGSAPQGRKRRQKFWDE